jgi:hypothetical protein
MEYLFAKKVPDGVLLKGTPLSTFCVWTGEKKDFEESIALTTILRIL